LNARTVEAIILLVVETNESTFILRPFFFVPGKIIPFLFIFASCTFNQRMSHEADYPGAKLANDLKKIYISVFQNIF
jgi:hypothetical protein